MQSEHSISDPGFLFHSPKGRKCSTIQPMSNLFDILPSRLFSVFNRADRRANYDMLAYIYSLYNGRDVRLSIGRAELVRLLTGFISMKAYLVMENEDGVSLSDRDARGKALAKINQFRDTGWLEADASNDRELKISYSLNDNAGRLLRLLISIAGGEEEKVGYSGYFYAVYRLLVPFDMEKARDAFSQVVRLTDELFQSLQGVISAIKRFIDRLLMDENLSPEDILRLLLDEYEEQGIVSVFNDLKGKDNPSKFTLAIIDELELLRGEKLDELTLAYMRGEDASSERLLEVKKGLRKDLEHCIRRYLSVNDLVAAIDEKNARFYSSSVKRLRFILNTSRDVSGRIDALLKILAASDPKADYGDVIPIEKIGLLDENSLYSEPIDREKEVRLDADIPPVDRTGAAAAAALLFTDDAFSMKEIDEYVLGLLGSRDELLSTEIPLTDDDDVYRYLLLQMYSTYKETSYSIEYRSGGSNNGPYRVRNFALRKKEARP